MYQLRLTAFIAYLVATCITVQAQYSTGLSPWPHRTPRIEVAAMSSITCGLSRTTPSLSTVSFGSSAEQHSKNEMLEYPLTMRGGINDPDPQPRSLKDRRRIYSSLWAFTSLNYIYADLVGLMDKNILLQYQAGSVDGTRITPEFLTMAAVFMQIPLSNVILPQVIKNDRTLRCVQIASGTLMSLVQTGTLFVGKPAPHYVAFSLVEVAATTYITLDALKWKTARKVPKD
jgi:hypothetical protein